MQAIRKIERVESPENPSEISKEDILSMQIFLESLEEGIRNAKFSSVRRRISRNQGYRLQKGKKINSKDQDSQFFFQI
jgi:hypothetical protein